jgi:tellurite methyltransferase
MENQKRNWDDIYRDVESLWDLRPSFDLVNYASLIPAGNVITKMVFQFLCVSDIKKAIQKCKNSLVTGGFIYMSVFSTEDPSLEFLRGKSERLEENTYLNDRLGSPMHFFTLEEVRQHFTDFEIILLSFSKRLDISHGEPHYHGVISCMAKKI